MFSTTGLFSRILCPVDEQCDLPNCLFRHEASEDQRAWGCIEESEEVAPKRRKIETPVNDKNELVKAVPTIKLGQPTPPSELSDGELAEEKQLPKSGFERFTTLPNRGFSTRPISPPPISRDKPAQVSKSNVKSEGPSSNRESLNPRRLQRDPAQFSSRLLYLKKLHEMISRLNDLVIQSNDPETLKLALDPNQLITMALDEEEKIAKENHDVYSNVIKLRMVAYKRMNLEQWKMARLEDKVKNASTKPTQMLPNEERPIETGLTPTQERVVVRRLLAAQHGLEPHGYVTSPPTTSEIIAAREGVECSKGWEKCERCQIRFQVFPDRREDGSLTSGGTCTYHPGRIQGTPENKSYDCCHSLAGTSLGCTEANSHVFKIYDGKRLASILQYECTPPNSTVANDSAVTFDCEMAFTVNGMELIRLTANAWPTSEVLLDILVKPLGQVLDWNTRYSGVSADDITKAKPYDFSNLSSTEDTSLRLVESPVTARELMFRLLSPSTPLIGHAIENDLNVVRIVHPCIIDTVILFPHPRRLPYRQSLKKLAKDILWRSIQKSSERGHDSIEDAKATGDLVREKVRREWGKMKRSGWTVDDDGMVVPPTTNTQLETESKKRSHDQMDAMDTD